MTSTLGADDPPGWMMGVSMVEEARKRREAQTADCSAGLGLVSSAIDRALGSPGTARPALRERLVSRCGWGDDPTKRRKLYDVVVKLHAQHEEEVERLLAECWADSLGARKSRVHLFLKMLCVRLREAGLGAEGREVSRDAF